MNETKPALYVPHAPTVQGSMLGCNLCAAFNFPFVRDTSTFDIPTTVGVYRKAFGYYNTVLINLAEGQQDGMIKFFRDHFVVRGELPVPGSHGPYNTIIMAIAGREIKNAKVQEI